MHFKINLKHYLKTLNHKALSTHHLFTSLHSLINMYNSPEELEKIYYVQFTPPIQPSIQESVLSQTLLQVTSDKVDTSIHQCYHLPQLRLKNVNSLPTLPGHS